ncbi:hypothetical protein BGX38DRAFT_1142524 [Terfezia claveryi]|nr:hypothetical protein BGX38DRAFT_1142524 [Terfezia claveryi]
MLSWRRAHFHLADIPIGHELGLGSFIRAPGNGGRSGIATKTLNTVDGLGLEAEEYHDINHLSFRAVEPVNVKIRNLSMSDLLSHYLLFSFLLLGEKESRTILGVINADTPAGGLVAIIGGRWKRKDLNAQCHRPSNVRWHFLHPNREARLRHAEDVLIPTLIVRDTLLYSAQLRLPASTTHEERVKTVEEVILQLGLKECANTRIGDNEGCSRQLFAIPLLVIDIEAFGYNGMDNHYNKLLCSQGYQFPSHENPADFLLNTSAVDNRTPEVEESTTAQVSSLIAAWREHYRALVWLALAPLEEKHLKRQIMQRKFKTGV